MPQSPNPPRRDSPLRTATVVAAVLITGVVAVMPAGSAAAGDITGYRSANFGMSEAALRAAIEADFGIAANQIRGTVHDTQKNMVLTITVNGLVPGSGKAEISYLLGFQSQTLFQVSILWRASDDSAAAIGRLLLASQTMINRFALLGFPEGHVAPGKVMENGAKLLFRSQDKHGKLALIGLYSPSTNDGSGSAETSGKERSWLLVSFVKNAGAPDIFKIEPGQF